MKKNSKKIALLATAAIGVMYSTGYILTATAANAQNPTSTTAVASASTVQTTQTAKVTAKLYKDGTYYGEGSNRIGAVGVNLTIANDKITDVQIVNCTTSYPEYLIANLPAQVLSTQSTQVDNVSGATESTRDFKEAVRQALLQAKA